MKTWLMGLAAVVALALPGAAWAQLPPELLGGGASAGPVHSEPFYKGPEGLWMLMRNPQNDGLHCAVNFITPDQTFAIHGPWNADMANNNRGMYWFGSKNVPKAGTPVQVQITVTSSAPTMTLPAMHVDVEGRNSQLILMGDILASIKQDKHESDEIGVQLQGKEVFRLNVIRLQEAYRTLERCVSAGKTK